MHLVGDDQHRQTFPGEFFDDREHLLDHGGIQGGSRLIKEDDLGIHGDSPDNGDSLLLSSGKLSRKAERLVGQTDHLQKLHTFFAGFYAVPL